MIMACGENDTAALFLFVKNESLDQCKSYLQQFPDALKRQNHRRETALHIAVNNSDLVNLLLNNGADVNKTNYWGQTPLHYAAQAMSVKSIRRLLQDETINANCKDANGYTALHYVFSSIADDPNTWKNCLDDLVDAGIDINSTTNTKRTVLHHISYLHNPSIAFFYFEKIFSKCKNVNLFSKDLEGKTFLHTWNQFKELDLELFKVIERFQNKDTIKQLLNQTDFSGTSTFMKIVYSSLTSTEILKTLVKSYGGLLSSTDNLQNTALHFLSTVTDTPSFKIIELTMEQGIEVNAKNIFGQTALSLLNIDSIFEVFSKYSDKYNVEWSSQDRWNRSPFSEIICNKFINRLCVYNMHQKHKDFIAEEDIFKSTPLHLAAYVGNCNKVKLLMCLTPDDKKTVIDKMGDTPADTAFRHGNFDCSELLNVNDVHKGYKPPTHVDATSLKGLHHIRELLNDLPENLEKCFDELLLTKHISNSQNAENIEDKEIIASVNKLVNCICDYVKGYDSRFEMSIFQTGSTAEGTKVGPPNEFDFALCIKALSQYCNVETPANAENQFVCLRFKENEIADYVSFSDENGYFVALPFLHYLFCYVKRALKEEQLWVEGQLSIRPDEPIRVFSRKPVFNFNVHWNGSKYKKLKISIDLLPVVHKLNWWPSFISRIELTDEVKKAGCFVILHSKLNEFDKEWVDMNDNINSTCKRYNQCREKQSENKDHLLLRVSVAPAEIALMRSLDEKFKKAYALAKIVLMNDVCPSVNIDYTPTNLGPSFKEHFSHQLVYNIDNIKSYWIKNCTFYVAERTDCEKETLLSLTILIYEKLLEFMTSCELKAYLFLQSDILAQEKSEGKSVNDVRKLLLKRKVCIDMVLGFLGKPFPEDNSEWILKCEQHYKPFKEEAEVQTTWAS